MKLKEYAFPSLICQEFDAMSEKYEQQIDQLSRDNRRLQNSLKDSTATCRSLREQNKTLLASLNEREQKLDADSVNMKLLRDRNEKLRKNLIAAKAIQETKSAHTSTGAY